MRKTQEPQRTTYASSATEYTTTFTCSYTKPNPVTLPATQVLQAQGSDVPRLSDKIVHLLAEGLHGALLESLPSFLSFISLSTRPFLAVSCLYLLISHCFSPEVADPGLSMSINIFRVRIIVTHSLSLRSLCKSRVWHTPECCYWQNTSWIPISNLRRNKEGE